MIDFRCLLQAGLECLRNHVRSRRTLMDRLQAALYHRRTRLLAWAFSGMRHPGLRLAEGHWRTGMVRRALSAWREHTVEAVAAAAAAEPVAPGIPKRVADAAGATTAHVSAHHQHVPVAPRSVHFAAAAGSELERQARQLSEGAAALVATVVASLAGTEISGGDGSIVISLADLCVAQASASSRPVQEAPQTGGLGSSGTLGASGGTANRQQHLHGGELGAACDGDGGLCTFAAEEMASEWRRRRALHQMLLAWRYLLPSTTTLHGRGMGAAAAVAKRGGAGAYQDIPLRHDQARIRSSAGRHMGSSRPTSGGGCADATHINLSSAAAAGACRREALPTQILSRIPKATFWS